MKSAREVAVNVVPEWTFSACPRLVDGSTEAIFDTWDDADRGRDIIERLVTRERAPLVAVLREVMAVCAGTAADVRLDDRPAVIAQRMDALVAKVEAVLQETA